LFKCSQYSFLNYLLHFSILRNTKRIQRMKNLKMILMILKYLRFPLDFHLLLKFNLKLCLFSKFKLHSC